MYNKSKNHLLSVEKQATVGEIFHVYDEMGLVEHIYNEKIFTNRKKGSQDIIVQMLACGCEIFDYSLFDYFTGKILFPSDTMSRIFNIISLIYTLILYFALQSEKFLPHTICKPTFSSLRYSIDTRMHQRNY